MNHGEDFENLRERITQLRQALKPPLRCKTPTKAKSRINTSRDVSPTSKINNYTPLSKNSSTSKVTDYSVESSVNNSFNPRSVSNSKKSERDKSKSSVKDIQIEAEKLQRTLQEEIEAKIELGERLESNVEQLRFHVNLKKQERRTEVDKNIVLHSYVIKHSNSKADLDTLNREIENLKRRLENFKEETAQIRNAEETFKSEIDILNAKSKELRNDNTVMKFENKKLKKTNAEMVNRIKGVYEKYNHNAIIVNSLQYEVKQSIQEEKRKVCRSLSRDRKK